VEELLVTAVGYLRLTVEATGAAVIGIGVLSTTSVTLCMLATIVLIRTVLNYFLAPNPPIWRLLAYH
jgi:uncharacterized membrane protein